MKALMERLTSLRFRLAIGFAIAGVLISALTISLSYSQARNNLLREKQHKLTAIAANAALQINGDLHAQLQTPADMDTDAYRELQAKGFAIAATDPEILYVYTMRKNTAGEIYFVLDAGHEPGAPPEEYQPVEIGSVYESPSGFLLENFDTLRAPAVETEFYTDEFGTYLTAYAPFYRSDGQLEGIVGVDILAQDILAQQQEFFRTFVLLFLASAAGAAALGWLAGTRIANPVLELAKATSSVREAGKRLELHTGIRELNQVIESFNDLLAVQQADEEQLRRQAASLNVQNEEIQQTVETLEKRAGQLEIISEIVKAATSLESLPSLLPRITTAISERMGYYHVGIFLLDENNEYAVLRAANSPGGQRMLARGHKLKVGQTGIVGYVSALGAPRIALDVGADAVYFDNPDLPETRSEIALPLIIGRQTIGVLDVQSTQPNAFQQEDVRVLTTLADQIAVAIQNARSFESMQELLEKAQRTSVAYLQDAWRILQADSARIGFKASGDEVAPLSRPWMNAHNRKALTEKQTVAESGVNATLAVPIRLRGEVIGVLDIHTRGEHEWDEDEVDIAEAVAERLSLALETSLLLKTTQRRAELERITTDISSRITATTQIDAILRTAVEELSRALGGSEVLVQLHADTMGSQND
ncbi:MAG: GAF domain-containing protein [Chloroflexota bacterium]|jgi:GAF domain-containing protein